MDPQEINVTIKVTPEIIDAIAEKVIEKTNNTTPKNDSKLLFTINEVVKMTLRKKDTIYRHIRAGLLIANKSGKSYLITEENLNNYIHGK